MVPLIKLPIPALVLSTPGAMLFILFQVLVIYLSLLSDVLVP